MNHQHLTEKWQATSRRTGKEWGALSEAIKETLHTYCTNHEFSAEEALGHIDELLASFGHSDLEIKGKKANSKSFTNALQVLAENDSDHPHATTLKNVARIALSGIKPLASPYKYAPSPYKKVKKINTHAAGSAS